MRPTVEEAYAEALAEGPRCRSQQTGSPLMKKRNLEMRRCILVSRDASYLNCTLKSENFCIYTLAFDSP
jgi:hypothetical protein